MSKKVLTFQEINNLSVFHNYFDGPIQLFSNLYLIKFLEDTSANCSFWKIYQFQK